MKYLIVALSSFPGSEAGPSDALRPPWLNYADNIIKVSVFSFHRVHSTKDSQFDIRTTIMIEPVRSYKLVNDFFKYIVSLCPPSLFLHH
jgi:hypothetical protein